MTSRRSAAVTWPGDRRLFVGGRTVDVLVRVADCGSFVAVLLDGSVSAFAPTEDEAVARLAHALRTDRAANRGGA
jgi:hypothetical protein